MASAQAEIRRPLDPPIAPGVPDMHSLRVAQEMGYVVRRDGLWWPEYRWSKHGKTLLRYVSPDGRRAKNPDWSDCNV